MIIDYISISFTITNKSEASRPSVTHMSSHVTRISVNKQQLDFILWLFFFRALLWWLMSFFGAKTFRLSDWSIGTTWYQMLLSDWLHTPTHGVYYSKL